MAAINLGEMFIQLGMDDSNFNRGIARNTKKLANFGRNFGTIAKTATIAFTAISAGIGVLGGSFIKAASSANELRNVIDVTFGENSKDINNWANNLSDKIGRSMQDLKQFAGVAGGNLRAAGFASEEVLKMSKSITQLSQDISSLRDIDPEKAFSALMSGITGSSIRPLRQFGVDIGEVNLKLTAMRMGLGDNLDALTNQQKMLIRLNAVLEQTKYLQGDAANTVREFANASRAVKGDLKDVSVAIGNEFLPAATEIVNWIRDITKQLKKVDFERLFKTETIKKIQSVTKALLVLTGITAGLAIALLALANPIVLWGTVAITFIGAVQNILTNFGVTWEDVMNGIQKVGVSTFKFVKKGWDLLLDPILTGVNAIIDVFANVKIFLKSLFKDPKAAFVNFAIDTVKLFGELGKKLVKPFSWAFEQILKGMNTFLDKIITSIENSPLMGSKKIQEMVSNLKGITIGAEFNIEDTLTSSLDEGIKKLETFKQGGEDIKKITADVRKEAEGYKIFAGSFLTGGEEFDKIISKSKELFNILKKNGIEFGGDLFSALVKSFKDGSVTISEIVNKIFDGMVNKTGVSLDKLKEKIEFALAGFQKISGKDPSSFKVDFTGFGQYQPEKSKGFVSIIQSIKDLSIGFAGLITKTKIYSFIMDSIIPSITKFGKKISDFIGIDTKGVGSLLFGGAKDEKGNKAFSGLVDMFVEKTPMLNQAINTFTQVMEKTKKPLLAIGLSLGQMAINSDELAPIMEQVNKHVMEFANFIGRILRPVIETVAKGFVFLFNYAIRPFANSVIAIIRLFGKILKELGGLKLPGGHRPFKKLGEMGKSLLENVQYLDKMSFKGLAEATDDATSSVESFSDSLSTIANQIPEGLKLMFKKYNSQLGQSQINPISTSSFASGSQILSGVQTVNVNVTTTEEFNAKITNISNSASANQNLATNGNNLTAVPT